MLLQTRSTGVQARVEVVAVIRVRKHVVVLGRVRQIRLLERIDVGFRGRIEQFHVYFIVFVGVINQLIDITKSFLGILEVEIATPRKKDVVPLVSWHQLIMNIIDQRSHLLLSIERPQRLIIINVIILLLEPWHKAVPISKNGRQYLFLIAEVGGVWAPEELV